jgi:hypothetical protein
MKNKTFHFTCPLNNIDSSGRSVLVSGHLNNGTGPKVDDGLVGGCSVLFTPLSISSTTLFERS